VSGKERLWLHWAGERLYNNGGQVELVVFTCLWHLNLLYWSHYLPQVTDFKIQGEFLYHHIQYHIYQKLQNVPMVLCFKMGISSHSLGQITWFKDNFVARAVLHMLSPILSDIPRTKALHCVHYKCTKHWNSLQVTVSRGSRFHRIWCLFTRSWWIKLVVAPLSTMLWLQCYGSPTSSEFNW